MAEKKTKPAAKKTAPVKKAPAKAKPVAKLAIDGGEKVWNEPFPMWPQFNPDTDQKVLDILHSGKVAMYNNYRSKEEVMLSELEAVSFFGEMGIISDEPRNATAVVESNGATVEAISREDLQTMIHKCPNKVYMILRDMSYRLRKLNVDFLKTCKEITDNYKDT